MKAFSKNNELRNVQIDIIIINDNLSCISWSTKLFLMQQIVFFTLFSRGLFMVERAFCGRSTQLYNWISLSSLSDVLNRFSYSLRPLRNCICIKVSSVFLSDDVSAVVQSILLQLYLSETSAPDLMLWGSGKLFI